MKTLVYWIGLILFGFGRWVSFIAERVVLAFIVFIIFFIIFIIFIIVRKLVSFKR